MVILFFEVFSINTKFSIKDDETEDRHTTDSPKTEDSSSESNRDAVQGNNLSLKKAYFFLQNQAVFRLIHSSSRRHNRISRVHL